MLTTKLVVATAWLFATTTLGAPGAALRKRQDQGPDYATGYNNGYNQGYNDGYVAAVPEGNTAYNENTGINDYTAGTCGIAPLQPVPTTEIPAAPEGDLTGSASYNTGFETGYPVGYPAGYQAKLQDECNMAYYTFCPQPSPAPEPSSQVHYRARRARRRAAGKEQW